jgi:hypothetical protein
MFVTQELVRNKNDVNEHERLSNITLKHKSKQRNIASIAVLHFAVEVDMYVNEHERPSNITLKHKSKQRNIAYIAVVHFTVTVGERLYNFTDIYRAKDHYIHI